LPESLTRRARPWDFPTPPWGGRHHLGMVAGFSSEYLAGMRRNLHVRTGLGHGETNSAPSFLVRSTSVSGIYFRPQTLPGRAIAIVFRSVLKRPHCGLSANQIAFLEITNDSIDSRSFETDTNVYEHYKHI